MCANGGSTDTTAAPEHPGEPDDADVIVAALSATINDFLVTETKTRYKAMMLERQQQFEDDHPVTEFFEGHGIAEKRTEIRGRLEPVDRDGGTGPDQAPR